ncbi:MAG: hypothetical protein K8H88_12485 [Sandaracinaceae bacterium]|nr:hypothetical protein [Sandaracinaceae bacterium]
MSALAGLDPDKILETARRLEQRIVERFPESGLSRVCGQLVELAGRAKRTSRWIRQPNPQLRLISLGVIGAMLLASVAAVILTVSRTSGSHFGWADAVQVSEAAINDLVLLGAAIWFFVSFETRFKRGRVLKALHELRTLAHLIDVHQLTKSPEVLGHEELATPSSPKRRLTPWQMGRYLDYCGEMLSLTAKIAALYSDGFEDPDAVDAVTDLENLTAGMQSKIWQKLVLLESRTGASLAVVPESA